MTERAKRCDFRFEAEIRWETASILDEDYCQIQEELAATLGITLAAISKYLEAARYTLKQGYSVIYELKPSDVRKRLGMAEMLLERYKNVLASITITITNRKKSYVKPR